MNGDIEFVHPCVVDGHQWEAGDQTNVNKLPEKWAKEALKEGFIKPVNQEDIPRPSIADNE